MLAPAGALEEGRRRVLRATSRASVSGPGRWMILDGYLKPYASVRHTHYGVDAALQLRKRHAILPKQIRGIALSVYPEAITYCGNRQPKTAIQAQFSLTYAIAAALCLGDLGPEAYGDALFDADIVRLERLATITPDLQRVGRGAKLSLDVGGAVHHQDVASVLGDPGRPMTAADAREKFLRYAQPTLNAAQARAIVAALLAGAPDTPVRKLFDL